MYLAALFLQRVSLVYTGTIGIVIGVIFGDLAVRCLDCGKPLTVGRLPDIPRFCPNCGKRLKEE